jgi:uncharacterized protein YkwD
MFNKSMKVLLVPVVLLLVWLSAPGRTHGQANELVVKEFEKQVFELINKERQKTNAGLKPLVPNAKLFASARGHAENMVVQGMQHILDGKKPSDRAQAAGFKGFVEENIAMNTPTPEATVALWMKPNDPHRDAILNPKAINIGVGFAQSKDTTIAMWCVDFGGVAEEAVNPPTLVTAKGKTEPQPPARTIQVQFTNRTNREVTFFLNGGKGLTTGLKAGQAKTYPMVVDAGVPPIVGIIQADGKQMNFTVEDGKKYAFMVEGNTIKNFFDLPGDKKEQPVVILLPREKEVLDAINEQRTKNGLPELKLNFKLCMAARAHAVAMARANQLDHNLDGKTPTDRVKALGYPSEVAEVYNGGSVTAQDAVAVWLAAPTLKAKLLNDKATEIGVGFTQSADTTNVWNIVLGSSPEADNPARAEVAKEKP